MVGRGTAAKDESSLRPTVCHFALSLFKIGPDALLIAQYSSGAQSIMIRLAAIAALVLAAGTVQADEVWTTASGDIIYEGDVGDTAIMSYPLAGGAKGYLFFPGLAGNVTTRGLHAGYWMAPGESCKSEMTGANGFKSKAWGPIQIIFDAPGSPAGWTLLSAVCFGSTGTSTTALIGKPKPAPAVEPAPLPEPAPTPMTEPPPLPASPLQPN